MSKKNIIILVVAIVIVVVAVAAAMVVFKPEANVAGTLEEIINEVKELKGEIVIIVEGCKTKSNVLELNTLSVEKHFEHYQKTMSDSEAMKQVAKDRGVSKSVIYKQIKC